MNVLHLVSWHMNRLGDDRYMLMVQGLTLRGGCQLISPAEKELTTGTKPQIALENKV